ncbi:MAG: SPASM domain-containing protein [Ruminiclostridium sp.]|nr:SPASM domain-containing protein [Ruminiclostridium sp.]
MELKEGMTPGGKRKKLADELPLDTPYLIQIFPAYACNFRCNFCLHSLDRSEHGYISDRTLMDMELYRKCIDDIKQFPRKLKMLRFAAIGEPLVHPGIAEMIAYAKKADVADSVDIVTNGSLLSHELSDKLIGAGLDRLRISVDGLSEASFAENTGVKVDFGKYVEQIRYFYEHAENTHIYIKIIDYMVQKPETRELFFRTFGPICHSIAVEHLTPTISEIDYDSFSGDVKADKPQNGEVLLQSDVCPQGFYMMQINPDGKVVPCCSMKYPSVLGDTNVNTVNEIWNGKAFSDFRLRMLDGVNKAGKVCGECKLYLYDLHEEDVLDADGDRVEELKRLYRRLNNG